MIRLSPPIKHLRILLSAIVLTTTILLLISRHQYSQTYNRVTATSTFEAIARARLKHLQARFQQDELHDEVGLKIGNPQWNEYVAELEETYDRYFTAYPTRSERRLSSDDTSPAARIRQRLHDMLNLSRNHGSTNPSETAAIPQTIHTTSRTSNLPDQFNSWGLLNTEDGWNVRYYDDNGIWEWMTKIFGTGDGRLRRGGDILSEYEQLPSGVLRADFFRYLVLLMEGGIYTDTDTACVRPLRDWPGLFHSHPEQTTRTDPVLSFLPSLPYLLETAASFPSGRKTADDGVLDVLVDQMNAFETHDSPSLVVALEHDHWATGAQDWREIGHSRGMQFVQWTMLAQPGHPVFLDTLGRIMRDIEKHRVIASELEGGGAEEKQDKLLDVLDFTGPGVFSDAVFRYLLARWGVYPRDISGATGPVRIGDVLIYPMHSFRADASEQYQGEHKLVWHGFFGTWKDE